VEEEVCGICEAIASGGFLKEVFKSLIMDF
jgi:hypothetical protein